MNDFFQGLGFGLILQISVGPVCIAVLHKGITQGFRHALAMVAGVALVDALYILLSVVGVSAVLQIEAVRGAVGLIGALLLAGFGIRYLLAPVGIQRDAQQSKSPLKSFSFGVGLTLTNPLTILFWGAVLGAMMATRSFGDRGSIVWFAAGCVVATLLFLTAVAAAGHLLERVLSNRLQLWLNRAVGMFLIGFAIKLGIDLLK